MSQRDHLIEVSVQILEMKGTLSNECLTINVKSSVRACHNTVLTLIDRYERSS